MVEHWFDTRTGDQLIGEAAVAQRLEESGPGDVLPLADIVLAESFPYDDTEYETFNTRDLSREDLLDYGRWIIHLLSNDERFRVLRGEHLRRLWHLGVAPGRSAIEHHLKMDLGEYREAIGAPQPEKRDYREWTRRRHVERARRVEARLGHKPNVHDLTAASREGDGPPHWEMSPETGGTPGQINECLGYPNVLSWKTPELFVRWGAHVMEINGGRPLTQTLLKLLAARKRGPSPKTIAQYCDSLGQFQEMVIERYQTDPTSYASRRQDAEDRLQKLYEQKMVNTWVKEHVAEPVEFVAKYDILVDSLPDMDELERQYWALEKPRVFMKQILERTPEMEPEDIYLSAIATKHTDDIWKLSDRWRDSLVVGQDDIFYLKPGNRAKFTSPVARASE